MVANIVRKIVHSNGVCNNPKLFIQFNKINYMAFKKTFPIELDIITKEELLAKINSNSNYMLVDTIGSYDGNKNKIKTATTIDYPTVIDRRDDLKGFDEIIIYCKHSKCVASKKVAIGLKMLNISNILVYEGGIDEWEQNDLPIEKV